MSHMAAAELKANGKLQFWVIKGNNELFSSWKTSDNANAGWTHLSPFGVVRWQPGAGTGPNFGGILRISEAGRCAGASCATAER